MKIDNATHRGTKGASEDMTVIWLCLLTVFITLWL